MPFDWHASEGGDGGHGGGGGGHGGGGGGGHGGGGHFGGFGGHGGGGGGHRGGISFGARGGGTHFRAAHFGGAHVGRTHIGRARSGASHVAARSAGSRSQHAGVAASRRGGAGNRFAAASAHGGAAARMSVPGRRVFGNRAIANVALQSQFPQARFQGAFSGSAWPWWLGGFALGWFGPVFWPYAYYDLFDYAYWPYAYDDFWPYAYDDVYYGIYGPYAYYDPGVNGRGVSYGRYGGRSRRYAATTNGPRPRAAEVCSNRAPELTDWPIERISEVVQPTDAQRLDELRAASAKAIEILQSGCPKDLPSIPTGRLSAMENRLQVMLAAVQTVRPALDRLYQSLSDEQQARFN